MDNNKNIVISQEALNNLLSGPTLRDQMAMAALTGAASNAALIHWEGKKMCEWAYEAADAMLEARERKNG